MGYYDWEYRGTWNVRPSGAWDGYYDELWQNTTATVVKLGAKATVSTSRSGNYVSLTSRPTYYSPNSDGYRPWAAATVRFYYKDSAGNWRWAKTTTSNSSGVATARIYASSARDWKAVVAESSTKWSATSATSRR